MSSFRKLERLFLYFKPLSCPKATSPFCRSGKRIIYSWFASERKYCSLIVIVVPSSRKGISSQSLFLSKLP